jgi:hypothetical protein
MIHLISLLIPMVVLLPNIAFFATTPNNVPSLEIEANELSPIFTFLENVGRIGVFIIPIFASVTIDNVAEVAALIGMLLALVLYYVGWMRYFMHDREYMLLFSPLIGIPIPMAISPIIYFLCAAVILQSPYLLFADLSLAAGHILISIREYRRVTSLLKSSKEVL